MPNTFMLQFATAVLENECHEWDIKINRQYERSMDATEASIADPSDFAKGIMSVLEQDRLAHLTDMKNVEMQHLTAKTREWLFSV